MGKPLVRFWEGQESPTVWTRYCGTAAKAGGKRRRRTSSCSGGRLLPTRSQVYQATDTNLDRQVAIKALPDAFSSDPDRLARFEREAKVLASLNHPNIGVIYGLEKAGDTRALVLELVEGPTLADRIAQGPIPIDEALPIAKQIAEALEAAHEAGVIHRDLKPANIKVKDDGTVKVLDFGLAKALDTTPEGALSQSPTLTAAATQMGVIMGTAVYMSPEQAKGRTVDKRADVWAFGAVLFEMLTGRRAFPGEDLTDTIAAVMKSEPAWDALPADTAPRLTQILHACLEKDRARRVRDLGDVQLAMEGAFESLLRPTGAAESSETAGRRRSLLYVVGGIALLVGVAIGGALRSGDDGDRPVQRFALSLPSTAKPWFDGLGGMAISPDGTRLVYVTMVEGQRVLAAQRLGQRDVQILPGTEGALRPFFSPDSQRVGFFAGGPISSRAVIGTIASLPQHTLKHVALAGGAPMVLASDVRVLGATWGDDGSIVYGGEGLQRVLASGGTPEQLTKLGPDERFHGNPHLLPGSRAVLFSAGPPSTRIYLHSIGTEERTDLVAGIEAFYVPSGHLVVGQAQAGLPSGNILASPFDLDSLTLGDPLVPVEENVRRFSVSGVGTLLYSRFSGDSVAGQPRSFVWVDRQGREEAVDPQATISRHGSHLTAPRSCSWPARPRTPTYSCMILFEVDRIS